MDRKSLILQAAFNLFVEKGYHNTSTALISKTAGVSTGILFHHFSSKEAVACELYQNCLNQFYETAFSEVEWTWQESIEEGFLKLCENLIEWTTANSTQLGYIRQFEQAIIQQVSTELLSDDLHDPLEPILHLFEQAVILGEIREFEPQLLWQWIYHSSLAICDSQISDIASQPSFPPVIWDAVSA